MVVAVVALVLGATGLGVGLAALGLAATLTKRIGARDPLAIPLWWRQILGIKALPLASEGDFSPIPPGTQRVAFIANPTKAGVAEVREQALRACSIRYLPQPMWLYTTPEDSGAGAAATAVAAGADLVVAVGGDGTVRAVASVLAGSDTPLGVLPIGTGNIFARNLDLPLGDLPQLLRIALEGSEASVDVGWLEIDRAGDGERLSSHPFLVMAGAGIDAEMVAGADEVLKKRLGWVAYFFAAIKHMGAGRMQATVAVDELKAVTGQMRTVLFANVGRLPGGFKLIPDATYDDGKLDVATLDARAGIVGWTELFGTVVAQGAGFRQSDILKAYRASRIDHASGARIELVMDQPYKVQADGELLGRARRIVATVDHGALKVRK